MIYHFEDFVLDPQLRELRRGSDMADIEPQVFDVLLHLIANHDRVVGKDELFDSVWRGRVVSDSTLSSRINAARRAVGDSGEQQRLIRTVPRRGFRFVGDIHVVGDGATQDQRNTTSESTAAGDTAAGAAVVSNRPGGGKPRIAVLPFDNLSGDPEQAYFSDGITEDIISELSQMPDLFILARDTAFALRGAAGGGPGNDIVQRLGVQFVLTGSVRRAGDRVRINVNLMSTGDGQTIWSERFDQQIDDIFAVQDEITQSVARSLGSQILGAEFERARRQSTDNLDAYDAVLRAYVHIGLASKEENERCRQFAHQALRLDPNVGRAYAILAWSHGFDAYCAWTTDYKTAIEHLNKYALESVRLDPHDYFATFVHALSHLFARRFDRACEGITEALRQNPNNAESYAMKNMVYSHAGYIDEALDAINVAIQYNPLHPGWYNSALGRTLFLRGDFSSAEMALEKLAATTPNHSVGHAYLAATQIELGKVDRARDTVAALIDAMPHFNLDYFCAVMPFQQDEHRDMVTRNLKTAGFV